ncbi:MAG: dUTP diphosphatase [Myxococcota bacterium]|nr:dUTP diphosphatase [Myxococcota bacterium]MDW8363569.1 dUTP diphosphatase [Myxococcales bacterium]
MNEPPMLRVRLLRAGARPPWYATAGAAGLDLHARLEEPLTLVPGGRSVVPTGIAVELPPGHEGQVRPRSGLAARHGVTLLNAPGTIDEDYRGEVCVVLVNLGAEPYTVRDGDRIAQLVVAPITRVVVHTVQALEPTARGEGGFGSTGTR